MKSVFLWWRICFFGTIIGFIIAGFLLPIILSSTGETTLYKLADILVKLSVISFLVSMWGYSFYRAFTAQKTSSKILIFIFSFLMPVMSGYLLYLSPATGSINKNKELESA
jgi:hypothetical protein